MSESESIKKLILQKLIRANIWGGKHIPLDFVMKGLPEHYRNTHKGKKAIDDVIKELVRDEWVNLATKKTGKGTDEHVSLNPRKVAEIRQFLDQ
jgi:hypothetical protein